VGLGLGIIFLLVRQPGSHPVSPIGSLSSEIVHSIIPTAYYRKSRVFYIMCMFENKINIFIHRCNYFHRVSYKFYTSTNIIRTFTLLIISCNTIFFKMIVFVSAFEMEVVNAVMHYLNLLILVLIILNLLKLTKYFFYMKKSDSLISS